MDKWVVLEAKGLTEVTTSRAQTEDRLANLGWEARRDLRPRPGLPRCRWRRGVVMDPRADPGLWYERSKDLLREAEQ